MKMLGLNPMEQEIVDLTNEITRQEFYCAMDVYKEKSNMLEVEEISLL